MPTLGSQLQHRPHPLRQQPRNVPDRPGHSGKLTARMKDGTRMCGGFQTGKCKNKAPCPQQPIDARSFSAERSARLDGPR